jgi:hypothetical protein
MLRGRAYELYGEPVGSVRGKMVRKKQSRAIYDDNLIMDEKKQVLHVDVMHLDGQHFLVTVCEPLQLVIQSPIERETALVLGNALQNQIELLRSRGFNPIRVHADPQSAFRNLTTKFENIVIDTGGAGDYVPKVDIQIRRIKEMARGVKATLPWKLPPVLLKDLVAFAVSRINIKRSTAVSQNVCARVRFTGIKPDYRKELSLGFGDYCEVYDGTDSTTRSRTVPCIALYLCCNYTGSWAFYNLISKTRIRRTHWKKMVTTPEFAEKMNALDTEAATVELVGEKGDTVDKNNETVSENNEGEVGEPSGTPVENHVERPTVAEEKDEDVPDLVDQDQEEDDSDDEADESDSESSSEEEVPRRSARLMAGVKRPARFRQVTHTVKLKGAREKNHSEQEEIDKAQEAEIRLVFEDLKAVDVIKREYIPRGFKAHNTHLFTVQKFLANGEHDKYKSRLVAHGNKQDATLYSDRSSPTASIHSITTCLTIAAYNPDCVVGKLDVKGAFIQTEMSGTPVYVQFRGKLREMILSVKPELAAYVGDDGILYGKLLKALYGCVQASRLWYEKLKEVLIKLGYEQSETDPCIFRQVVGDRVFLLIVYVDDILILATADEIKRLEEAFTEEFRWITLEIGKSHSYLGMQLYFGSGFVTIDMTFYVDKILSEYQDVTSIMIPARKDLFRVNKASELLKTGEARKFHTTVARLLYLSRRGRPDIITVVGFLCTRVKSPMIEDSKKLMQVLGYLKQTKRHTILLKPAKMAQVEAYIDASYAIHEDGKSHTGLIVMIGGVPVFSASRKQKCACKSPTGAELVALSDNLGFIELFQEFLGFVTNSKTDASVIFQDNTSVISMVTSGGGITRTKHMRARMFLLLEAVQELRVKIKYVPAALMIADGLTKSLDGKAFDFFAKTVLGHDNKSTGGRT